MYNFYSQYSPAERMYSQDHAYIYKQLLTTCIALVTMWKIQTSCLLYRATVEYAYTDVIMCYHYHYCSDWQKLLLENDDVF